MWKHFHFFTSFVQALQRIERAIGLDIERLSITYSGYCHLVEDSASHHQCLTPRLILVG